MSNAIELAQYLEAGRPTELELLGYLSKAAAELRRLAAVEAELAVLREQEPLQPHKYWHDGDIGYDFPDEFELIGEAKIGDLFEISEAYYFRATYKVIKEYNEDEDIDPEVKRISGVNIYDDVGHDASITDAELKLIMDMRKIKENHGKQLIGIDLADDKDSTISTVFAAPKEDFKIDPFYECCPMSTGLGVVMK